MSESNFLDGKITRRYLVEAASIEMATKKKPKGKGCEGATVRPCPTSYTGDHCKRTGGVKRKPPVKK